jgi:hypothetical protein
MEHADGMKAERTRETPQGGVVSPILAVALALVFIFLLDGLASLLTRLLPDPPKISIRTPLPG